MEGSHISLLRYKFESKNRGRDSYRRHKSSPKEIDRLENFRLVSERVNLRTWAKLRQLLAHSGLKSNNVEIRACIGHKLDKSRREKNGRRCHARTERTNEEGKTERKQYYTHITVWRGAVVVQAELCIYSSLKRLPVAPTASLPDFLEFCGVRRSAAIPWRIAFLHTKRITVPSWHPEGHESTARRRMLENRIEHSLFHICQHDQRRNFIHQLLSLNEKSFVMQYDLRSPSILFYFIGISNNHGEILSTCC